MASDLSIIGKCVKKNAKGEKLTTSDKIDKIVTNRILALPIFIVVMWLVYYIAMSTVGAWCTDWTNDNLFGDGFHLFGIGSKDYKEASGDYDAASNALDAYGVLVTDDEDAVDVDATKAAIEANTNTEASVKYQMEDEETLDTYDIDVYYSEVPAGAKKDKTNAMSYLDAVEYFNKTEMAEIDPADYGVFVPSIPDLAERGLDKIGCADWLKGLILDGIIAGVGAVLGFVPQMLVLFILLAILEYCGYMARIAFIMDRIFRKFGLSGKSFIPILVGVGCGVPGIMASRTIENEKDRRMTVMTTTFIPCGAKVPFIAMIAGAIFGNARGAVVNLVLEGCAEIAATDCALFAKELQGAIVNCCARNCIIVDVERGYSAWDVGAFASRVTEKAVVEQCTSENNQVIAEDICGDNINLNVGGIAGSSYGSIRDCRVQGGVVIFNKQANVTAPLTDLATDSGYKTIEAAIKQGFSSGTNTHAGLLAGKQLLDEDTEVAANRKYLIFVSDGITYMYNAEPTATAWSFKADSWLCRAEPDNWKSKYDNNNPPDDWSEWMNEIGKKVAAQGTAYEYPYGGKATNCTPKDNYKNYANSIDKALYLTYQVYQEAKTMGYN